MGERASARILRAGWPALAWAAFISAVSHQSRPFVPLPVFPGVDKVVHGGVFGILALLVARSLHGLGSRARTALLAAAVAASLYGALDEWHQSCVPGRSCDPMDWAADTVGGVLGAALAVGLPRRKSRASIRG